MLDTLSEEVLNHQIAWGGTLVLRALHWATLHAGVRDLLWQVCYRWVLLAGWVVATGPLGFAFALQRWRVRQRRDDYSAMQHRARAGWRVLGLLLGTGVLLLWPAPLIAGWVPGWAGGLWLGLVLML
ncbi:MAG: hypothetical protein G3I10_03315 [Ferrovum sp.]|nr:hypothetical protein [Ferrovum sp.]